MTNDDLGVGTDPWYRLLETGSTQLIRNTAAQQLAEVQKTHPEELFNLLTRVIPYLRSKSWDTRTAAAKAIGGIVEHADRFDPNVGDGSVKPEETDESPSESSIKEESSDSLRGSDDQLQLETLDLALILRHGQKLLGSAGNEYDFSMAAMDPAARLAYQKKRLRSKLGLGGEYIEDDLVSEKDFASSSSHGPIPPKLDTSLSRLSRNNSISSPTVHSATTPRDSISARTPSEDSSLSRRQLNQLKRKNKANAKSSSSKIRVVDLAGRRTSDNTPETPSFPEPYAIRSGNKVEENASGSSDYFNLNGSSEEANAQIVSEYKGPAVAEKSALQTDAEVEGIEWPFERLCEFLMIDLFDQSWEIRHGAAMGLREVIRVHGGGAGRERGKSRKANDLSNQRWLGDLACRLCCIFMLDRFGDYISDNVVAPIRETAGQTLGALLVHLSAPSVRLVFHILHRLVMQKDLRLSTPIWEVCHGGMIGLRYLVAVRNDLLLGDNDLIDGVLQATMKGLGDPDDDVRAVSAATLIPIAKDLVAVRGGALSTLINVVWDCLSDLRDDLSASIGSVMDLLAKLCAFPEVLQAMKQNASVDVDHSFARLVPRLYPFLRHTITSVRSAVLRALLTFLDIEGDDVTAWVNGKILRLTFQNLLVERDEETLKLSQRAWIALATLLRNEDANEFVTEFMPHLEPLMTLSFHPIGVSRRPIPMDPTLFLRPSGQTYHLPSTISRKQSESTGSESAPKRRRKSEKKEEPLPSSHNIDAHMMQGDIDLVGADVMIRSRIYAAQAMGTAMSLWPEDQAVDVFGSRVCRELQSTFSTSQLIAGMMIEEYAKLNGRKTALAGEFAAALHPIIDEERPIAYRDLVPYLQIVRAQCQSLLNHFRDAGGIPQSKIPSIAVVVQGDAEAGPGAFSIANAEKIVDEEFGRLKRALPPAQRIKSLDSLNDTRTNTVLAIEDAKNAKERRDIQIRAAAAGAIVALDDIPKKPSQLIKGVMDSVKSEENRELQHRSALAVASLVQHFVITGRRGPVDKITSNLVKFCCVDTSETPEFHRNRELETQILSLRKEEDRRDHPDAAKFEREAREARIMRRGAKGALDHLARTFGKDLLDKVSILRSLMEDPLRRTFSAELPEEIMDPDNSLGQEVVDGLSTIRALVAGFDPALHPFIIGLLPLIVKALHSKLSVLRYAVAKCLASICGAIPVQGMTALVEQVLPFINNPLDLRCRQGGIECIYRKFAIKNPT